MRFPLICLIALSVFIWTDQHAYANGFFLREKSAIGTGMANAGMVARAGDASTVYFNPAGMTRLPASIVIGTDVLDADIGVSNKGTTATTPGSLGTPVAVAGPGGSDPIDPTFIPHVYGVYPLNDRVWLGLAVTTPFGITVEYDDDWFGRYDSTETEFLTIDIAPSLAWKINGQWSVGGGINIQFADGTLKRALPDPLNPGGPTAATDGEGKLKGDDWSVGFNVGVLWEPLSTTRLGLHYRSRIDHTLEGDFKTGGLTGPVAGFTGKTSADTEIDLPDIVSLGIAQSLGAELTAYFEVSHYGWGTFDEIRAELGNNSPDIVRPQDYEDNWAFAAGLEYQLNNAWTLRGGARFDESPANDDSRNTSIADADTVSLSIGFSYQFDDGPAVDAGYQRIMYDDAPVNTDSTFYEGTAANSVASTRADYDTDINIFALSLRYTF